MGFRQKSAEATSSASGYYRFHLTSLVRAREMQGFGRKGGGGGRFPIKKIGRLRVSRKCMMIFFSGNETHKTTRG